MKPTLTFLGGAGTVTGSQFLVETGSSRVLIDAGLFQGAKELRLRNWDPFPVDPAELDAVVLTHAHVDHCGLLPRLCSAGFTGPVWCTPGTAALAGIVLPDSGHLQEEEAAYANRAGFSKHRPALPLYTEQDALRCLEQFRPVPFGEAVTVAPEVSVVLGRAGHILGSATATLTLGTGGPTLTASGDLGRSSHPLLRPPDPPPASDWALIESTYGDRRHADGGAVDTLADAINRTILRGGSVLIPAFAVDRTEVLLHHLGTLAQQGRLPDVPVFVDSPLALAALRIYREATLAGDPDLRADARARLDVARHLDLREIHDVEGSKALNTTPYPCIVISASGMATGGRVVHHLFHRLPDPRTTVVLVGFQAEGTRGRSLADGATVLKMLGRYVRVRAEIVTLAAFSVHADQDGLVGWLRQLPNEPRSVFVVHGEPEASRTLAGRIDDELGWLSVVPRLGERVRLE